jgi:hypothetical protein
MKRKIVIDDLYDVLIYVFNTTNPYTIKYDNEIENWCIEEDVEEV